MAFDPDAYLAAKTGGKSAGFDPDAYLASKGVAGTEARPTELPPVIVEPEDSPVRTALGVLPTAGSIVGGIGGGILGTAAGPAGTAIGGVAGAGVGQGAGEALKALGEKYILGKEQDPLEVAKNVGREAVEGATTQAVGGVALKGLGLVGKTAAKTKAGQGLIEGGKKALAKAGSQLSGVPEKVLRTYAKYADEVAQMGKKAQGDLMVAADEIREGFMKQLQNTRQGLNAQISKAIEGNADEVVSVEPVLKSIDAIKSQINKTYYPELVANIDDFTQRMMSQVSASGKMTLKQAMEAKEFLQDQAQRSYLNAGQVFSKGDKAEKAAKAGAAALRKEINANAPEIAKANNQLQLLHTIEKKANKGLLGEGKPTAALSGAGSGENVKAVQELERLGKLAGTDMLGEAEKFAAMRYMYDPQLLPVLPTGKTATQLAVGMGTGSLVGGPGGAIAGGLLTSPLVQRSLIDAGRMAGKGARKAAPLVRPTVERAVGAGLIGQD